MKKKDDNEFKQVSKKKGLRYIAPEKKDPFLEQSNQEEPLWFFNEEEQKK